MSSAEKKRLRDRRSQQTLRDKKLRYATELEQKVAHCEKHHSDQGVQRLLQVVEGLRKENEALLTRQSSLKSLVKSWDADFDTGVNQPSQNAHSLCTGSGRESLFPPFHRNNGSTSPSELGDYTDHRISVSETPQPPQTYQYPEAETIPLWAQVPPHNDDFSSPRTVVSCPWFAYLEQVTLCPDTPASPLDILYGTKTNALANMIHTALQRRPIRDPERLAIGWLNYHMSRWILATSPATYERLPLFLRPVQGQMEIAHPMVLDFLPWPKLRLNLIRQWRIYHNDRDGLFGMFACCVKIRWPWGEPILERNARNELEIKKTFYETFMSESGWGLTPEFIARYPDLMAGIDTATLVFEVV